MTRKFYDTSLRYLETVRCLPIGQWRTTVEVHQRLADRGYEVSKRTVERDLLKLAAPFGLDLEGAGNANDPYQWRRTRGLDDLG